MNLWKKTVSVTAVTAALVAAGFGSAATASAGPFGMSCPDTIGTFEGGACTFFTQEGSDTVRVFARQANIVVSPPVPDSGTTIRTLGFFTISPGTTEICAEGEGFLTCDTVTVQ